ncbi:MAG TPA: Xaa-Pro peptidase family protein [Planctomycetota bacterium]|nr:Xaa-Pro peptidase family protein [Planctomycetota bacterium]
MAQTSPRWPRRQFLIGSAALPLASACAAPPRAASAAASDERARLDELLADLRDQSANVSPISEPERAQRRIRLGAALARAGFQALICEGGATMTWLSGVSWGHSERVFALVVFADGTHAWICPAFEADKARLRIDGEGRPGGPIATWNEHEYAFAPLAALLRENRVERAAVDPQARFFIADCLGGEFGRERVHSGAGVIAGLRMVKEARELALLRKANELTKQAIAAAAKHIHTGQSSAEIAALITRAEERVGLDSPWNLSLPGAAAAYPHGETANQKLEAGDLLLVDTGGTLHGYQSDITRTWAPDGAPRARELRAWHSVRSAQSKAFDAIRPGAECRSIDRAARESIAADGWGSGYAALTHRLGHGIGVEGHEDPYFDGNNTVALRAGMTLSNEPGIYVLGEFGVRIEDIVAVTDNGAEVFGPWQQSALAPD